MRDGPGQRSPSRPAPPKGRSRPLARRNAPPDPIAPAARPDRRHGLPHPSPRRGRAPLALCGGVSVGVHSSGGRGGVGVARRLQAEQAAAQAPHPEGIGGAERGREQRRRGVGVQLTGPCGVAQHHQQRHDRGLAGQWQLIRRCGDRDARGQERPPQRRERPPRRAREHRHPRPRHAFDEMRPAQLVGDPACLLRRRGEHAHGHAPVACRRAAARIELLRARPSGGGRDVRPPRRLGLDGIRRIGRGDPVPPLPGAGQPGGDRRAGRADGGRPAVIRGEHDRLCVDGLHARRIGAAEREDGLVGVAREQHRGGAAPEHADQLHLLRIEILRVVDHEVAHPLPLRRQQLGIRRERVERRSHQLGRIQRGCRGLWRPSTRRSPQQGDLLVAAEEPPRRRPLGDVVPRAKLSELVRPQPPLGGAQQQLAQLGGETRHRERRLDPLGPAGAGDDAVDLAAQQVADQRILLGAREQPRWRIAVARSVQAEHAERVGVDGADQRLATRPPIARAEAHQALPQLRRSAPAPHQHQRARRILPRSQPTCDGGEQQGGLARAGAADDPQRPRRVREDAPRRPIPDPLGLRGPGAPHERGSERCGHASDATTRPRQFRGGTGRSRARTSQQGHLAATQSEEGAPAAAPGRARRRPRTQRRPRPAGSDG